MNRFQLNQEQIEAICARFFFSLMLIGRGVFLILITPEEVKASTWYSELNQLLDLNIWGMILLTLGAMVFVSIFDRGNKGYFVFTIANILAVIVYIIFSSVGINYGINLWTPFTQLLLANAHLLLTFAGGYKLWKTRKMEDM